MQLPGGCKRKARNRRGRRVNVELRLGNGSWSWFTDRDVRVRAVVGVIGGKRLLELHAMNYTIIVFSNFCMQMHTAHLHGEQR